MGGMTCRLVVGDDIFRFPPVLFFAGVICAVSRRVEVFTTAERPSDEDENVLMNFFGGFAGTGAPQARRSGL